MKIIRGKNGKQVALMNPSEKAGKYAEDLRNRISTNPINGEVVGELTPTGASYRMGYLAARKDSAKCYKANKRRNNKSGKSRRRSSKHNSSVSVC